MQLSEVSGEGLPTIGMPSLERVVLPARSHALALPNERDAMTLLQSGVTSSRPMQGVPRDSWTMRAMTTLNHSRTNCGLPSECDPELPITSTIQILPSGWITKWTYTGSYRPSTPSNRRHDFSCAGKIDCPPTIDILINSSITRIRDF